MSDRRPRRLTREAIRPFGRIIDGPHVDAWRGEPDADGAWDALASHLIGGPTETRTPDLRAGEARYAKVEVHHLSPQITALPGSDWLLVVYRRGCEPPDCGSPPDVFLVPRGMVVSIDAGIWHSGIIAAEAARGYVAFQEATLQHHSAVRELAEPVELSWR